MPQKTYTVTIDAQSDTLDPNPGYSSQVTVTLLDGTQVLFSDSFSTETDFNPTTNFETNLRALVFNLYYNLIKGQIGI